MSTPTDENEDTGAESPAQPSTETHDGANGTAAASDGDAPPASDTPASKKPVAKPGVKPGAAAKRPGAPGAKLRPRGAPLPPAKPKGGMAKSMFLFVVIVGGLAAGFAYLGKEEGAAPPKAPTWKTGETVEVEITLVSTDQKDLACASPDEIAGRHCGFEAKQKAWSKPGESDDKHTFRPYTTTDRVQFIAAGVWDDPALKGNLPKSRFSVKCKYTVEGKLKKPAVRWNPEGPWYNQDKDWYAGVVSACVVTP